MKLNSVNLVTAVRWSLDKFRFLTVLFLVIEDMSIVAFLILNST